MVRISVVLSLVGALAGCAPVLEPLNNAVGTRRVNGVEVPFATSQDLLVAGLVDEAIGLGGKNRFFEAEGKLRKALYLVPENERVKFNLAMVLEQIGQSEESVGILKDLQEKEPQNTDYLVGLGQVYVSEFKYDDAIKTFKEAFQILKSARNDLRASRVARSLSSTAFKAGREQEALCYSYEALTLSPTPLQLGDHGRLLIALNLYETAKDLLSEKLVESPLFGKNASVKHALALARFALGDFTGALQAADGAIDFINLEPDLGGEANAAWYVIRQHSLTGDESESEIEKLKELKETAIDFRETAPAYQLTLPPLAITNLQELVSDQEE